MKKISIVLVFIITTLSAINNFAFSQCKQQFIESYLPNEGIFLKSYTTTLRKPNPLEVYNKKWSLVLNEKTHYRFELYDNTGSDCKTILELYTTGISGNDSIISSTYVSENDRYYPQFDFICKKTGVYYINMMLSKEVVADTICGVVILSFVGKGK